MYVHTVHMYIDIIYIYTKGKMEKTEKNSGNYHGSFDADIYTEFKYLVGKGNVRKTIEDFMRTYINRQNSQIDGLNLQEINLKIAKTQAKMIKIQSELQEMTLKKQKIEENIEKNKLKKLENERIALENQKKCIICGKILEEFHKTIVVNGKNICKSCYLTPENHQKIREIR
jgi:hypothetical protein